MGGVRGSLGWACRSALRLQLRHRQRGRPRPQRRRRERAARRGGPSAPLTAGASGSRRTAAANTAGQAPARTRSSSRSRRQPRTRPRVPPGNVRRLARPHEACRQADALPEQVDERVVGVVDARLRDALDERHEVWCRLPPKARVVRGRSARNSRAHRSDCGTRSSTALDSAVRLSRGQPSSTASTRSHERIPSARTFWRV